MKPVRVVFTLIAFHLTSLFSLTEAQSFERTGRDNQWELLRLVLERAQRTLDNSGDSSRAEELELRTIRFELLKAIINNTKIWLADPAEIRANQNTNTLRLTKGIYTLVDGATCLVLSEAWESINLPPKKLETPTEAFSRLMPHYEKLEDCLVVEGVQESKEILLSFLENASDGEIRSARLEFDILDNFNETKRGRFDFPLPSLVEISIESGLRTHSSFFKPFTTQEKENFTNEIRTQNEHILASHMRSIFLLIIEIGLNFSGDSDMPELFPNLEKSIALLTLLQDFYEKAIRRGGFDNLKEDEKNKLIRDDIKFLLDRSVSIFS